MATPRFRKPKPFGARSEKSEISEPKKSFFIICEGEKTENQFNEILEKCKKYGINIGFTNPTFEFWLLLHLPNINEYGEATLLANEKVGGKSSKRFVEKELSNRLTGGYNKNQIRFERFLPNVDLAIAQEKLFKNTVNDIFYNVGSNIGILISKMKQL